MDIYLKISFEKLIIPLYQINEGVLDISYNDKNYRLKYPMKAQFTIRISPEFQRDYQVLTLTVLKIVGKKYKKVARGEINFYKKYLYDNKRQIEKWIYLTLFQKQLETKDHKTDIVKAELNTGKIYMKILLPENFKEISNKLLLKDPVQEYKTEKYRSIVENSNDFLKMIKSKKTDEIIEDLFEDIFKFDDGISNISVSVLENDPTYPDLTELNNEELTLKMKKVFNEDPKQIFPNNIEELKKINEELFTGFKELKESYFALINDMKINNENIRVKAKEIYEKYKEIKEALYKDRIDFKEKKDELSNQIKENIENNTKLLENINSLNKELIYFKNEMGIESQEENFKSVSNIEIEILSEALKKVHKLGYDIFTGSGLNDDEKQKVKNLLNIDENVFNGEEMEIGNRIVMLIEEDVNNLYFTKAIHSVKIDQIDANSYDFSDQKQTLTLTLKVENNQLLCEDGMKFSDWLVDNFSGDQ